MTEFLLISEKIGRTKNQHLIIKYRSHIYSIYCLQTGTYYIGCAEDPILRARTHLTQLTEKRHPNRFLQADFDLHGMDAFEFTILEGCYWAQAGVREAAYYLEYRDKYPVYNINPMKHEVDNLLNYPSPVPIKYGLARFLSS
jgi:hypothetical protein